MTRKRIRHELVSNDSKRNSVFSKRAEGLLKKANQLCILCGVDIAVVAHRQGGDSNVILWPSPEGFHERLNKFMEFPNVEKNKKMVTHERYMEQAVSSETENAIKARKAAEAKEAHQLLAGKAVDDMDLQQLTVVGAMAEDMLKALYKRAEEVGEQRQAQAPAPAPAPAPVDGGGSLWDAVAAAMGPPGGPTFSQSLAARNDQQWAGGLGLGVPPSTSGSGGAGSSGGFGRFPAGPWE